MVHKTCSFLSLILLIFLYSELSVYAEDNTVKNVLVLNSYHRGLCWTDNQTNGILSILKNASEEYKVHVEYMDWKNYPNSENLKHLYSYYKYKYGKQPIDAIITTDDAALEFAISNREELFSSAPIIFCGVNKEGVEKIAKGHTNITGIIEQINAEATMQAALKINPKLKEAYVIFDNTESGISTGDLTTKSINRIAPNVKVIALNKGIYEDILKQVERAKEESVIIITTYYKDENGTNVGFEEFSKMVSQRSTVPVFHLYDFGLGHGAIGGSIVSGKSQGEYAGKTAIRILQGEDIEKVPIDQSVTTQYLFDFIQLERFGIDPEQLPNNSQLINKSFSFLETYKNIVKTVIFIFIILIFFICFLIYYLKKISIMKEELTNRNIELAKLYEDLTASDEELKRQIDELTLVQRNLTASEEQYAILFEKMLNGFAVLDPVKDEANRLVDVRFLAVNPGFESHTDKKGYDIIGKTWSEVFAFKNRALNIYQKVLSTGEPQHYETFYPDTNVYYLGNAFIINENLIGVVFDNITEYKNAIMEVRKLNDELEQRVNERTDELKEAVSDLEAFTYTVSHDLKSPIRAMGSYCNIIIEDFEKKLPQEAIEMILSIKKISQDMLEMISKLLQYSMTSRSPLNIETIDMKEIFVSIYNEIRTVDPDRKIDLIIETDLPKVMGDRILIRQAIYNILSNAAKFTRNRERSLINVGCKLSKKEYLFSIKDNGVGFDMNYSDKLFGMFQRLHTAEEFEGSGIGLVTIKKVIEKHGGRVWIEGKDDVGATVYFTLPI